MKGVLFRRTLALFVLVLLLADIAILGAYSYFGRKTYIDLEMDSLTSVMDSAKGIYEVRDDMFSNRNSFPRSLGFLSSTADVKYYYFYYASGGIEAVNLANNHTLDFGQSGLKDTRKNLTKAGILWSDTSNYSIFTAKNGIKIGMCGYTSTGGLSRTYKLIKTLRSKGCQIVIVSCHWGIEATYKQTKSQTKRGRALINHGADIVVGTHPHRLQPIEVYKGKYILYSIGNFCFGGHTNPSDPDSVIIQCTFVMDETGKKVADYRLNVVPYSLRSSKRGNDYCPKPYAFESKAYDRVMSRLNWAQGDE